MGRTAFACLAALAATTLPAQTAPILVDDLLLPRQAWQTLPGPSWVWAEWIQRENENDPRLTIANETNLRRAAGIIDRMADFGFDADDEDGILTVTALEAALVAMGVSADSFQFRVGEGRAHVVADYPEQVTSALKRIRAQVSRPAVVSVRLERIDGDDTEVLLAARRHTTGGDAFVVGDVTRSTAIPRFTVEIASGATISNPLPLELTHGAAVLLRVRRLPFRDDHVAEVITRISSPEPSPVMEAASTAGPLDRVRARIDQAGWVCRPGSSDAPSVFRWSDLDGRTLQLTLAVDPTAPGQEETSVHIAATRILGAPVYGFLAAPFTTEDPFACFNPSPLVDELSDADSRTVRSIETGGGSGSGASLILAGADADRLARTVGSRVDDALAPARVLVEAWNLPTGTATPTDRSPASEASLLGRFEGPMLADLPVTVASLRQSTWIRDWNTEVAQGSRIVVPVLDQFATGGFLTVWPHRDAEGRIDRAALHIDLSTLVEFESRSMKLAPKLPAWQADGGPELPLLPEELVMIDQPRVASLDLRDELPLDADGHAELRQAAAGLLGEGRELVVRIRVTTGQ